MSLLEALRTAGLNAKAVGGWESRGGTWREGKPVAVMHHHTAAPVPFPVSKLYGTLNKCNINTKPDGTVWVLLQGACNYSSGSGSSVVLREAKAGTPPTKNAINRNLWDDTNGNPYFFNFENDHYGTGGSIPSVQLNAIVKATQVVLLYYGLKPGNIISHAEWTRRKNDPNWNGTNRAIEEVREKVGEGSMATYRSVINVPQNKDGTPKSWAKAVIDSGISRGLINVSDDTTDDWNRPLTAGEYWSFESRIAGESGGSVDAYTKAESDARYPRKGEKRVITL